jgi:tRNA (guanine-N7-)-methyltransferase
MPELSDTPRRSVRSYVMRAGRITPAQQRALAELWPRYGIDFEPTPLDLDRLFARHAPRTLEIGFGNGEHLIERARREHDRDFIGIEVHTPGVGRLLLAAAAADVEQLRVVAHDAVEVLSAQIPPASLDEVQLLFPDPWPKKRHHKRRLVQPAFATLVASRLKPGARWHIATDWEPYAEDMLAVLRGCPELENAVPGGGYAQAPMSRSATRFERRGVGLGHRVRELLFTRR